MKEKTEIYMRETTSKAKVITKHPSSNKYCMVMVLSQKQWEALKNSTKPVVVLKGGDQEDEEMIISELDETEKKGLVPP